MLQILHALTNDGGPLPGRGTGYSVATGALYTLASGAENGEIRCRHCDQTMLLFMAGTNSCFKPSSESCNCDHKQSVEQCPGDMQ